MTSFIECTNEQLGFARGYHTRMEYWDSDPLPKCPFPLWVKVNGQKVRNPERDEYLTGWHKGVSFARQQITAFEAAYKALTPQEQAA